MEIKNRIESLILKTKMKIEVRKISTEEIEVSLPMYIRNGTIHFYMIYNESQAIQVCKTKWGGSSIADVSVGNALNGEYISITKEDFENAFYIVKEELERKIKI